ncbi:MAG: hypothetical protein G8237_01945 [Magnetococcales bacterium]|nr:hypothetical protein [Magnetococcales bacterium]NGZ05096.1 hypothetical protein [Magnetococcales bacterium]
MTLEEVMRASWLWLGEQWQRLAEQSGASVGQGKDGAQNLRQVSRWPLEAFRVAFSQRGQWLARLWTRGAVADAPAAAVAVVQTSRHYDRSGVRVQMPLPQPSMSWNRLEERRCHWQAPACRVELSPPGRLAGGALSSLHAAPGDMDRFVEQIRAERRAGFYSSEVFQQARELLRSSGSQVSGQSG